MVLDIGLFRRFYFKPKSERNVIAADQEGEPSERQQSEIGPNEGENTKGDGGYAAQQQPPPVLGKCVQQGKSPTRQHRVRLSSCAGHGVLLKQFAAV
jgi:hypothetical protein